MASGGTGRTYRSAQRVQQARQTRRRMLEAATELFVRRGYAGTTMSAVAAAAGIAVPTLELAFRTKAGLLKVAIDEAIAGDDLPIPMLQRDWFARAAATGSVTELLETVAAVLGPAQTRSAGLLLALFEGARVDPELDTVAEQMIRQRALTAATLLDLIMTKAPLRAGLDRNDAVDTLWALMDPALFDRLTRQRRWSLGRYQAWWAVSIQRLLVADRNPITHNLTPQET